MSVGIPLDFHWLCPLEFHWSWSFLGVGLLLVHRKSPLDWKVWPEMPGQAPENHWKITVLKRQKKIHSGYPKSDGVCLEKQWQRKDLCKWYKSLDHSDMYFICLSMSLSFCRKCTWLIMSLALHPSIKDHYCKKNQETESYERGYASLIKVVCPSITNNFVLINYIVSLTPTINIQKIPHHHLLQGLPMKVQFLISLSNQLNQSI